MVLTVSSCCRLLREGQVPFIETVPFKVIAAFTVLQFFGLAAVYVVSSWTGVSLERPCDAPSLTPLPPHVPPSLSEYPLILNPLMQS